MTSPMQLVVLSALMFAGSYLSGSAPIWCSLSEEKLDKVSILGAGLLVGTALAVIVPEGVQTLIRAYLPAATDDRHDHEEGHGAHPDGMDRAIGISLVLGFLFMLLVDQLATSAASSGSSSLSTTDPEADTGYYRGIRKTSISWTTTLGLVVHAAADGIALGAAATTNQTDVEMIVFLAIMLHKAPAAFGLTTFLLHEGLDRLRVRRHLMVFALSAPITSVITFVGLHPSAGATTGVAQLDTFRATGIAMLFSAGTFLYVATVHVLPEAASSSHGHSHGRSPASSSTSPGGGSPSASSSSPPSAMSKCDLFILVLGALLPLLLTLGHHH